MLMMGGSQFTRGKTFGVHFNEYKGRRVLCPVCGNMASLSQINRDIGLCMTSDRHL